MVPRNPPVARPIDLLHTPDRTGWSLLPIVSRSAPGVAMIAEIVAIQEAFIDAKVSGPSLICHRRGSRAHQGVMGQGAIGSYEKAPPEHRVNPANPNVDVIRMRSMTNTNLSGKSGEGRVE